MTKIVITDDMIMRDLLNRYKKNNPAYTGDIHNNRCCCKRCIMDKISGYFLDRETKK